MLRRRNSPVASVEILERRDCPAVVSIVGPQTVNENGGPITLMATLSEAQRTPVEVRYMAHGTAAIGADYRMAIGRTALSQSGVFRFAPGQTSLPITVTPVNDALREGSEGFTFALIAAQGHTLGTRTVTTTIVDDDNYTARLLGPAQITTGGPATFTLQLSSPATKNETFYVSTRDGTATSKDDYYPIKDLPVTFTPGQSARSFTLLGSKPNTNSEFDEFYQLTVRPASSGFPAIPDVGVVIPGIGPEPAPTISIGNASGNEGNAGTQTFVFDVTLSKSYSQMVTVDYVTADGTATMADSDYTAASGRLTFLPGETRKTVAVSVIGDTKPEQAETFTLVLSAPTNATIANGTGVGTIVNDDGQEGFQITMVYDASVPVSIRSLFDAAAARWSAVIVGDLPGVQWGNTFIDDILIFADVRTLDPDTIAQAGFDDIRVGNTGVPANWQPGSSVQNGLPYRGSMTINTSFISPVLAPGMGNTIAHEMGHVLGFGSLWRRDVGTFSSFVSGIGTASPVYRGPSGSAAVSEYNRIFGATGATVPLYDSKINGTQIAPFQYDGSYGTHWRDDVFNQYDFANPPTANSYFELMTANYAVDRTRPSGGPIPSYLSTITVGLMQDLGYQVNYAAADNYVRPGAVSATRTSSASTPRTTTASFSQSPLSLAFALYQQLAEVKPSDGAGARSTLQRR